MNASDNHYEMDGADAIQLAINALAAAVPQSEKSLVESIVGEVRTIQPKFYYQKMYDGGYCFRHSEKDWTYYGGVFPNPMEIIVKPEMPKELRETLEKMKCKWAPNIPIKFDAT